MDGYQLFCQIAFGTSFDPKQPKKRKNKLKNYKKNKRRRLEEAEIEIPENKPVKKELLSNEDSSDLTESDSDSKEEIAPVLHKKREKIEKKKSSMELYKIRQEELTHFRRMHKIYVNGSDIPDPVESFQQLTSDYGCSQTLVDNITKLGYSTPTPIQMQAIPLMLYNRQILACAPTGSGKTAAFLIPLIHSLKEPSKGIRAVIIAPTRELVKQIYSFCVKLTEGTGLRTLIIEDVNSAKRKPNKTNKHDILISTPNRIVYLLKNDPPTLRFKRVQWLVVDESDKLFEVAEGGQSLRDQLGVIYKACESAIVKRAFFSATFSHDVEEWCTLNLDSIVSVSIGVKNTAVESVKQELLYTGTEGGKLVALRNLMQEGYTPPVLVFVQSKMRAQDLYAQFKHERIGIMHANLSQAERDDVVQNFTSGKIWVLICTELMARGIDFKGVNLVINFDFPTSAISYIHRIGRTGRAGEVGKAITYFTNADLKNLRSIAQVIKNAGCEVPDYIMKLKRVPKKNKCEYIRPIERPQICPLNIKYHDPHNPTDSEDDEQFYETLFDDHDRGKEKKKVKSKLTQIYRHKIKKKIEKEKNTKRKGGRRRKNKKKKKNSSV